jgi:Domain of unknown function (DUF4112)
LQAAIMTTAKVDAERVLRRLEALGSLLDSRFRLPGGFRFGLDPLIGLVPGVGDGISAIISLYIVLEAYRLGASRGTLARMLLNVGLDLGVGIIPIIGDVADFAFKSNRRNLDLLRRHLGRDKA